MWSLTISNEWRECKFWKAPEAPRKCKVTRILPPSNERCTLEKTDQWQRGKLGQKIMTRLPEQSIKVVRVFIEARKIFIFIFPFDQASEKFKNQRRMNIKYKFNFVGPKKLFIWWHCPFNNSKYKVWIDFTNPDQRCTQTHTISHTSTSYNHRKFTSNIWNIFTVV
jgi:hypothetical protein